MLNLKSLNLLTRKLNRSKGGGSFQCLQGSLHSQAYSLPGEIQLKLTDPEYQGNHIC